MTVVGRQGGHEWHEIEPFMYRCAVCDRTVAMGDRVDVPPCPGAIVREALGGVVERVITSAPPVPWSIVEEQVATEFAAETMPVDDGPTRVVYVAHPLGAGTESRQVNRERAARWVAWIAATFHVAPIADWIILSGVWPEEPHFRARGLAIDVALVARCDELWLVGGRISEGMRIEADAARRAGKRVVDLTDLGELPPGRAAP